MPTVAGTWTPPSTREATPTASHVKFFSFTRHVWNPLYGSITYITPYSVQSKETCLVVHVGFFQLIFPHAHKIDGAWFGIITVVCHFESSGCWHVVQDLCVFEASSIYFRAVASVMYRWCLYPKRNMRWRDRNTQKCYVSMYTRCRCALLCRIQASCCSCVKKRVCSCACVNCASHYQNEFIMWNSEHAKHARIIIIYIMEHEPCRVGNHVRDERSWN